MHNILVWWIICFAVQRNMRSSVPDLSNNKKNKDEIRRKWKENEFPWTRFDFLLHFFFNFPLNQIMFLTPPPLTVARKQRYIAMQICEKYILAFFTYRTLAASTQYCGWSSFTDPSIAYITSVNVVQSSLKVWSVNKQYTLNSCALL